MRKPTVLIAILITAALGMTTSFADGQTKGVGVVTALSGQAILTRAASPQPLRFKDELIWRDLIDTRENSIARILLLGKSTVTVRELSRLEIREEAVTGGTRHTLALLSGKIRTTVEPSLMGQRDEIEVRTPNAIVGVRGTQFITLIEEQPGSILSIFFPEIPGSVLDVRNNVGDVLIGIGLGEAARVLNNNPPVRFRPTAAQIREFKSGLDLSSPRANPSAAESSKAQAEKSAESEFTGVKQPPPWRAGGPILKNENTLISNQINKTTPARKKSTSSSTSCPPSC